MKGITVAQPGAAAQLSSELEVPEPSDTQILVKGMYTAVNPVDAFMKDWGLLVLEWPFVPGCDVSGVVVKAGENAVNPLGVPFKEGDEVFGCTRLGNKGYSAWQEQFLMDADVAFPKPKNITLPQAAATGVGVLTAFLGIFAGLKIPLVDPANLPAPTGEWVLVFGGASSVGKFAVQTLKVAGYKVATTCSEKSFELLKSIGADATVDYKLPEAEVISQLKSVTGGNLPLIFDAVSANNALASSIFAALAESTPGERYYTTTNDGEPLPEAQGFTPVPITLGPIGRPDAAELNKQLKEFIAVIVKLIEAEKLQMPAFSVQGHGIEGILKAWEVQISGKLGSTKVLVEVAEV
ncbi:GroES-like protein [Amniculicola lignicola CBS 123094]|uniref:GroES-like protein n=1 Tax=Amniculicola lignicola CBS 123094 TaxID=1392246 RepID=A0A6A5WLP9_9PLEO|nr:GroES-like protein [Amniculicola lignicola CBS 123094]